MALKFIQTDIRPVCRDEDPELFFPNGTTGPAALQIEEAKAVCRRCPLMDVCREYAIESGESSGVWGGTSEDERRAIWRRRARNQAGQTAVKTEVKVQEPKTEAREPSDVEIAALETELQANATPEERTAEEPYDFVSSAPGISLKGMLPNLGLDQNI